jgi:hypothetical protein
MDDKRAEVVGERTYGDASLRKAVTMEDGGAIILSVAKYYSPDGKAIQDVGVTPETVMSEPEAQVELDENGEPLPETPDQPEHKAAGRSAAEEGHRNRQRPEDRVASGGARSAEFERHVHHIGALVNVHSRAESPELAPHQRQRGAHKLIDIRLVHGRAAGQLPKRGQALFGALIQAFDVQLAEQELRTFPDYQVHVHHLCRLVKRAHRLRGYRDVPIAPQHLFHLVRRMP